MEKRWNPLVPTFLYGRGDRYVRAIFRWNMAILFLMVCELGSRFNFSLEALIFKILYQLAFLQKVAKMH